MSMRSAHTLVERIPLVNFKFRAFLDHFEIYVFCFAYRHPFVFLVSLLGVRTSFPLINFLLVLGLLKLLLSSCFPYLLHLINTRWYLFSLHHIFYILTSIPPWNFTFKWAANAGRLSFLLFGLQVSILLVINSFNCDLLSLCCQLSPGLFLFLCLGQFFHMLVCYSGYLFRYWIDQRMKLKHWLFPWFLGISDLMLFQSGLIWISLGVIWVLILAIND